MSITELPADIYSVIVGKLDCKSALSLYSVSRHMEASRDMEAICSAVGIRSLMLGAATADNTHIINWALYEAEDNISITRKLLRMCAVCVTIAALIIESLWRASYII